MPKLTPAQERQLKALANNEGPVNLGTIRALMGRGLVEDTPRTREELQIHCRMPSAYPLTDAGRRALAQPTQQP